LGRATAPTPAFMNINSAALLLVRISRVRTCGAGRRGGPD
jgi:hypothetical protein